MGPLRVEPSPSDPKGHVLPTLIYTLCLLNMHPTNTYQFLSREVIEIVPQVLEKTFAKEIEIQF